MHVRAKNLLWIFSCLIQLPKTPYSNNELV